MRTRLYVHVANTQMSAIATRGKETAAKTIAVKNLREAAENAVKYSEKFAGYFGVAIVTDNMDLFKAMYGKATLSPELKAEYQGLLKRLTASGGSLAFQRNLPVLAQ